MPLNILYISCHEVLEYDEVFLLTILGYNIRSTGSYAVPERGGLLRGPMYTGPKYDEKHAELSTQFHVEHKLDPELVRWADVIIFMHMPSWIEKNIELFNQPEFKSKIICYRAIGQSVAGTETQLTNIKFHLGDRFKIIRYSPLEVNIPCYAGEDVLIRFYKHSNEFLGWTGNSNQVMLCCQAASQRGDFCHINEVIEAVKDLPNTKLYGTQNEDLTPRIQTEEVGYFTLKEKFKEAALFVYSGTIPASYTLGFLEAFMTGTPILALDEAMWRERMTWVPEGIYEVPNFIGEKNLIHSVEHGKVLVKEYLENREQRLIDSKANRILAQSYFGQNVVSQQWKDFLNGL